jgi:hypothetical protein
VPQIPIGRVDRLAALRPPAIEHLPGPHLGLKPLPELLVDRPVTVRVLSLLAPHRAPSAIKPAPRAESARTPPFLGERSRKRKIGGKSGRERGSVAKKTPVIGTAPLGWGGREDQTRPWSACPVPCPVSCSGPDREEESPRPEVLRADEDKRPKLSMHRPRCHELSDPRRLLAHGLWGWAGCPLALRHRPSS